MKKSIIVLLILAILAGIGLTSCKNEIQAPVDELVSISFGYDSSRALTASLQTFDVDNYYWFYESEKADGSGLKSGQTGAGLTDLSSENAMTTVLRNALPANCENNVPKKGLQYPVEGFSKGLWNFRLFAVIVDFNDNNEPFAYHPVYIGEARNVLIDNDHHTVKVVVSPFSADYQISEEYGYLEIGNIQFKEASSQSSVTAGALTITDKVSSYDSSNKKWEEVSRAPVNGKFTLLGGTYLYERIYSLGVSEITRGSVVVTVYPNLTTTVSGFVTELTTYFGFETSENPDTVNVSAEATIAYKDSNYTSDTYTLAVDGQDVSKIEAEITKTAANKLIEELTDYFALSDSSIAEIVLEDTNTSMDLNLGVRTTATTAESVAYDINMTAVVTYGAGTDTANEMKADVKTVPDYVMVTVNMQSGVSVTSVTHSGHEMKAVDDIVTAGTEAEGAESDVKVGGIFVGFYKYDSVYNKLYIKTRSFSPFVVNYKYVESDSMAKVIRYVADKTDTKELSHASITSAEVEILELKSELQEIMKVLPAMDFSVNPDPTSAGYPAGTYNDILNAIQTGTFVTFMPKYDAAGKTADDLPESDAYYSGGSINDIEGWVDYLNLTNSFTGWRTDFRVITNDVFNNGDFYLVGHYVIGESVLGPQPITDISDLIKYGHMDVMKQLGGDYLVIPYDLLLGLCSTEDGVRHGFNCGAYAVSPNAYGKKITVQLILTNDNLIKEEEEPETVVCAEVICEFHAPDADQNALMSAVINQLDDSKQLLIHKDSDGTDCNNDKYMSLADFRDNVNGGTSYVGYTVTLQKDVDLKGISWTPIGTSANPFRGTFDGNGKTIWNLSNNGFTKYTIYESYDSGSSNSFALFGYLRGNVTIKDLTVYVYAADKSGKGYAGVVGLLQNDYESDLGEGNKTSGTTICTLVLDNLKTYGKVIGSDKSAGIIAQVPNYGGAVSVTEGIYSSTVIRNCENYADVTGDRVGGILAVNGNSVGTTTIINCHNHGKLTARSGEYKVAAGIIGQVNTSNKNLYSIDANCTNDGVIDAVIGYNISANVFIHNPDDETYTFVKQIVNTNDVYTSPSTIMDMYETFAGGAYSNETAVRWKDLEPIMGNNGGPSKVDHTGLFAGIAYNLDVETFAAVYSYEENGRSLTYKFTDIDKALSRLNTQACYSNLTVNADFEWTSAYSKEGDGPGGYSINLNGHTMTLKAPVQKQNYLINGLQKTVTIKNGTIAYDSAYTGYIFNHIERGGKVVFENVTLSVPDDERIISIYPSTNDTDIITVDITGSNAASFNGKKIHCESSNTGGSDVLKLNGTSYAVSGSGWDSNSDFTISSLI